MGKGGKRIVRRGGGKDRDSGLSFTKRQRDGGCEDLTMLS